MKNKIEDLRNHLFATLEDLRDPDTPLDLERATAICNVASVIVASAKTQVDYYKVTGQDNIAEFMGNNNQKKLS